MLTFDPNHAKAAYRLSQGYLGIGDFEKAETVLEENKAIFGDSIDVPLELKKIKRSKIVSEEKEKKMYSKMFA